MLHSIFTLWSWGFTPPWKRGFDIRKEQRRDLSWLVVKSHRQLREKSQWRAFDDRSDEVIRFDFHSFLDHLKNIGWLNSGHLNPASCSCRWEAQNTLPWKLSLQKKYGRFIRTRPGIQYGFQHHFSRQIDTQLRVWWIIKERNTFMSASKCLRVSTYLQFWKARQRLCWNNSTPDSSDFDSEFQLPIPIGCFHFIPIALAESSLPWFAKFFIVAALFP